METIQTVTVILLAFCASTASLQDGSNKDIYLLTLLPYPNPDPAFSPTWEDGDNIRPVLELAKDQINRNTSLLQNYNLHLIHAIEGCQETLNTVISFVEKAFQPGENAVTGIIGPGCSISTTQLSSLTNRTELSVVHVHGSGSPTLANRTLYQYMLGTLGSTEAFVEGFLYLANKAPWGKLAVLFDDSRLYYINTKRLLLLKTNASFLSPVSDTFIPLTSIQEQRLRVTFVLCPLELSRKIVCLAYHRSMIYDKYQFVIMDQLREELVPPIEFLYDGTEYKCSAEDMVTALEKALLITYRLTPSDDSTLISNTTYEDYLTSYTQYREDYNLQPPRFSGQRNSSYTHWATYLYDAVWAWALVLDNLTKSGGFEIGSEYGNKEQAEMIVEQFYRTRFSGMSGEISFDRKTGFVARGVNIFQVAQNTSLKVAAIKQGNIAEETSFTTISDTFSFNLIEDQHIAIFFLILVMVQWILSTVLHTATIFHFKKPSIKASSPKLLHLSYVGMYVVFMGVCVWILNAAADFDPQFRPYFCQLLWAWCLPVGFILSFVPVAMRTWRVYRIFKHYRNPGPLISDPVLIGGTLLAVLVNMVTAITWTALDPFILDPQYDFVGSVVRVKNDCNCQYYFYWLAFNMFYVVSILLITTIFALLTRNIPNKSFTTKSLRVLCYVMTLLFLLGFPLFYFLEFARFDPIYSFVVFGILLNLMMASFIVCIFLPPLIPIFKHYRKDFVVKVSLLPVRKDSQSSTQSNFSYISN